MSIDVRLLVNRENGSSKFYVAVSNPHARQAMTLYGRIGGKAQSDLVTPEKAARKIREKLKRGYATVSLFDVRFEMGGASIKSIIEQVKFHLHIDLDMDLCVVGAPSSRPIPAPPRKETTSYTWAGDW